MTTRPPLNELLTLVDMWFEHEDDTVGARAKLGKTGVEYFAVPKEELAQLHPLLPRVMQESMKKHNFSDSNALNGASVRSILALLQCNTLFCGGQSSSPSIYVEVYGVDTQQKEYLWLRGRHVLLLSQDGLTGPLLPIVTATQSVNEAVRRSVLDEHYPGWAERLELARSLDVPVEDYMSCVFVKPIRTEPALTELSFEGVS